LRCPPITEVKNNIKEGATSGTASEVTEMHRLVTAESSKIYILLYIRFNLNRFRKVKERFVITKMTKLSPTIKVSCCMQTNNQKWYGTAS
jgi:hypothetical protein